MSKKRILVIGALITGGIFLLFILMAVVVLVFANPFETNSYQITDPFYHVRVVTDSANVSVLPAEDRITAVDCYELSTAKHAVSVLDGTLTIQVQDTGSWYDCFDFLYKAPTVYVYLPSGVYSDLVIESESGDVEIAPDFRFTSVDVTISTGDVLCRASATGDVNLCANTGAVRAEELTAENLHLTTTTGKMAVTSVTCNGDVMIKGSTGKVDFSTVRCKNLTSIGSTGTQTLTYVVATETLSVESDTGDVRLNGCDANALSIKTNTGNVSGSLLSEKVFVTHADTGRIEVPDTTTGGKCEITTDTGNITIAIEK